MGWSPPPVAGIAGQNRFPTEISLIDRRHHKNHSARRLLVRLIVGRLIVPACIGTMAVLAGIAQGCGKETHRGHKLVHRQISQDLNVLEELTCGQRLFDRRGLRLRVPSRAKARQRQ